jgi:hypothetical protein
MSIPAIIMCIALGATSFYMYHRMGSDNKIVATWSKTNGKILKTNITQGRSPFFQLDYEYYVNGVRYQSNNIYRQNPKYGLGSSYDLDKLEFLKNPEVKYDPQNPTDCCLLIYNQTWVFIFALIAGIVLSLIGWIGLLVKIFK